MTSLKISNLSKQIGPSTLEDMFSLIGNVKSAQVVCDPQSGLSLGVAIIEMGTAEEAEDCILHYNGKAVEGQTMHVRPNQPHVPDPSRKTMSKLSSKNKGSK